jgi:hypothetical protein
MAVMLDAPDVQRHGFGVLEKTFAAYVGASVLLAFAIPESLYQRSESVRLWCDWMALRLHFIDELARISAFPGTTLVVLSVLWALVVPLALFIWLMPGAIRWREDQLRKVGIMRLAALAVIASLLVVPAVLQITPDDLESHSSLMAIIRLVSVSRFALGLVGGIYCGVTAILLACVPRLLNPKYFW